MISLRVISLVLVCFVTIRENFAFALTIIAPSATHHSPEQSPGDDSDVPDQLPADDSDLPAIVELELEGSDTARADATLSGTEAQRDLLLIESCLDYHGAANLSGAPDGLYGLFKLRI